MVCTEATSSIFLYHPFPSSLVNMRPRHSSSFKCFALLCGAWMSTGTTVYSHFSCWLYLSARLSGRFVFLDGLLKSSTDRQCTQRVRTLTEFRTMSVAPYPIQCYRDKEWMVVQTDTLLPGDLVSVGMSTSLLTCGLWIQTMINSSSTGRDDCSCWHPSSPWNLYRQRSHVIWWIHPFVERIHPTPRRLRKTGRWRLPQECSSLQWDKGPSGSYFWCVDSFLCAKLVFTKFRCRWLIFSNKGSWRGLLGSCPSHRFWDCTRPTCSNYDILDWAYFCE